MNETTVRLLWAAAGLLLVSGCIFAFLSLWRCAALRSVDCQRTEAVLS